MSRTKVQNRVSSRLVITLLFPLAILLLTRLNRAWKTFQVNQIASRLYSLEVEDSRDPTLLNSYFETLKPRRLQLSIELSRFSPHFVIQWLQQRAQSKNGQKLGEWILVLHLLETTRPEDADLVSDQQSLEDFQSQFHFSAVVNDFISRVVELILQMPVLKDEQSAELKVPAELSSADCVRNHGAWFLINRGPVAVQQNSSDCLRRLNRFLKSVEANEMLYNEFDDRFLDSLETLRDQLKRASKAESPDRSNR